MVWEFSYLGVLLFDVSLEPLKRIGWFVVDLAAFPQAEEQVLAAALGQVTVIDVEGQFLSAIKETCLNSGEKMATFNNTRSLQLLASFHVISTNLLRTSRPLTLQGSVDHSLRHLLLL